MRIGEIGRLHPGELGWRGDCAPHWMIMAAIRQNFTAEKRKNIFCVENLEYADRPK
jgi:hypothetical protein